MQWTSIVSIYVLFWVMGCYIALRFDVRTDQEEGRALVPGQADSAPSEFHPWRIIRNGTLIALLAFALYYVNWTQGWITMEDLDLLQLAGDQAAGK
jgi:predicted secreted protein